MNIQDLRDALQTVNNPDARVKVMVLLHPNIKYINDERTAFACDIALISITRVNGGDTLVCLGNAVTDRRGNVDLQAPPQIKVANISLKDGVDAARADLAEQLNGESTQPLEQFLEVERMKSLFRSLKPSSES